MNDESDSRMVRLPVREMSDEPAPQRAAQEGDLPPLPKLDVWGLDQYGSPTRGGLSPEKVREYARTAIAAAGGGVPQGNELHWQDVELLTALVNSNRIASSESSALYRVLDMLASSPQPEAAQEQPEKCGNRDYCGRFPFCGCGGPEPLPERDTSKPAEQQGLFRKFDVRRTDGSDKPGGKHYGCEYFVLDVAHDKHAKAALAAYAAAVEETHPHLAQDMRDRYELSTPAQPEAAPAVAQVPQGWKLVPVEPTEEMEMAGALAHQHSKFHDLIGPIQDAYAAMLAAAPETAAQADYKAWYDEAMAASNEAGFSGISAADTIRELSRLLAAVPEAPAQRCPYCDDTGDVHTPTGEWRGRCTCPAGTEAPAQAAPSAGEVDERKAFEEAARKEWGGKSIPDAAWIGWQLRAALSHKEQP